MIAFSSFAQTSKSEKAKYAKYAAYLDSTLTAEMISRRKIDDSTNQISIDCPVLGNLRNSIHIIKTINRNNVAYYLDLSTQGSSVFVGWKGAIILFNDGTKMKKPNAEIDIEVSDYGYRYATSIPLTQADLKVLSSKNIDKFRLNIFDAAVNSKEAELFRFYTRNIVKLK